MDKIPEQAFASVLDSRSKISSDAFHRPTCVENCVVQEIGCGLAGLLNPFLQAVVEGNEHQHEVVAAIARYEPVSANRMLAGLMSR